MDIKISQNAILYSRVKYSDRQIADVYKKLDNV